MEPLLMRRGVPVIALCVSLWVPVIAAAQSAPVPADATDGSRLWITAGAAWHTLHGDCQTCEEEAPYRHAASFLGNIGYRVNARMDAGAEVHWAPFTTESGHMRVTHLDAIGQYRLWSSKGFFLKGGAGMAFVRNWVDTLGTGSINSKALSVVIGGGWAFYPERRVGLQLFAVQYATALGDLKTAESDIADVMGNSWLLGGALTFR
jgi:hypothetical protein